MAFPLFLVNTVAAAGNPVHQKEPLPNLFITRPHIFSFFSENMRAGQVKNLRSGVVFFMTVLCIGGMIGLSKSELLEETHLVEVAELESAVIYNTVTLAGKTEEAGRVELYTKENGRVTHLNVSVGDRVQQGQLLFTYEPTEEERPVSTDLSQIFNTEDLAAVAAAVLEGGDLSSLMPRQDVFSGQGETITASGDGTRVNVRSPADGVVMALPTGVGDRIYTGESCAAVSNLQKIRIRVTLPERYLSEVETGMEAEITGEGFPDILYLGVVSQKMPYAVKSVSLTQSGASGVETLIDVQNADGRLLPGLSATVKIRVDTVNDGLLLPYAAVHQDDAGQEYVYLVEEGKVLKKAVQTGYELETKVQIAAGLKSGDQVILSPAEGLKSGDNVKISR